MKMEDEQIIYMTARKTALVGEVLLKVILLGAEKLHEKYVDIRLGKRIFSGETEWNKFMESLDDVNIKTLRYHEINLEKYKEALEKYNIGFSFYDHENGKVSFAYYIRQEKILEKITNDFLQKIVKEDNILDKCKKDINSKTLEEKINYYKLQEKQEIQAKAKNFSKLAEKELTGFKDMKIQGEKKL